jgi:hypothetical protein
MSQISVEELLEYHYSDTTPERMSEISAELILNWPLREKLAVISKAAEQLEKSLCAPSKKSVDFLLSYASSKIKTVAN